MKTDDRGRFVPQLDMHPLRVAERIRSHARDPKCAQSKAQVAADAVWNLLAWQFLYGEPRHPLIRKKLALVELADACDEMGEYREAQEFRERAGEIEISHLVPEISKGI